MSEASRRASYRATNAELVRLIGLHRAGDETAMTAITELVIDRAAKSVRLRARGALTRAESISAAFLAIVETVDLYEPGKGKNVLTLLGMRCGRSMLNDVRRKLRTIRVPSGNAKPEVLASRELLVDLVRLDRPLGDRDEALGSTSIPTLSDALGSTSIQTLSDALVCQDVRPDERYHIERFVRAAIRVMAGLKPQEQSIMLHRFINCDMTLEQVGKLHGVSKERIRQAEGVLRRKLRYRLAEWRP